jgi:hypothetical protein
MRGGGGGVNNYFSGGGESGAGKVEVICVYELHFFVCPFYFINGCKVREVFCLCKFFGRFFCLNWDLFDFWDLHDVRDVRPCGYAAGIMSIKEIKKNHSSDATFAPSQASFSC